RRHTRCLSDWSSDVCSSDLREQAIRTGFSNDLLQGPNGDWQMFEKLLVSDAALHSLPQKYRLSAYDAQCFAGFLPPYFCVCLSRSEERRVGKGCSALLWL